MQDAMFLTIICLQKERSRTITKNVMLLNLLDSDQDNDNVISYPFFEDAAPFELRSLVIVVFTLPWYRWYHGTVQTLVISLIPFMQIHVGGGPKKVLPHVLRLARTLSGQAASYPATVVQCCPAFNACSMRFKWLLSFGALTNQKHNHFILLSISCSLLEKVPPTGPRDGKQ